MPPRNDQPNLAVANVMMSVVSQVGCVTILLIGIALGSGMLLDRWIGTDGVFTVILIVASVPAVLYLVMRVSLRAISRLDNKVDNDKQDKQSEETEAT